MQDTFNTSELFDFMKDEVLPDIRISAVKQIDKHFFQVTKVASLANSVVIEDSETCERALDIAGDVRTLSKQIDEDRKRAIEPSRKIVQMVNDCAKQFQDTLDMAERIIKVKLAGYQLSQEIKADEAQKTVRELSETLGLDIEILAPNAPRTLSSAKASTSTREKLTFEILDSHLIPDEYWVVDDKLIQKHIAMGKREIPGVRLVTEKTMIIRRK